MPTVSYKHQPGIEATHGNVPLAGNSHIYTVAKVLWPESIETFLATPTGRRSGPRMIDARRFFDEYICAYSTLAELAEVLRYTHVFSSQCLAQVLREQKMCLQATQTKDALVEANQQDVV